MRFDRRWAPFTRIVSLGVSFGALSVAACSGGPSDGATAVRAQEIISGKDSASTQDFAILLVHTDNTSTFGACTGTLLAPNLVLTARHCVSQTVDQPFGCDGKGRLLPGSTGGTASADFDPTSLYVFVGKTRPQFTAMTKADARGKKIFHDGSKVLCSHDLALVLLDTPIPSAQIAPIRLDSPPVVGELFTAIGWGVTRVTPFPTTRQQRTGVKVLHVGPYEGDTVNAPVGPGDFEIGEAICQGDSGGPAYAEATSAVIGVVSRGGNGSANPNDPASGCISASNDYTQVAPFKDLILSAYMEAAQDPWIEGGPDPRLAKFSEACGANEECRSNVCNAQKCTQSCTTDGADKCPTGYDCTKKICVTHVEPPQAKGCATTPRSRQLPTGALVTLATLALAAAALRRRRRG